MQLEVSDLVFSYGEADVLKSVSFCADRGERIAVLGPNGVGKSTLFRCLLGFLEPKRGSVKIAGRDVRDYSRRALAAELAYIPQSYSPAFDHTVLDSVLMGLGAQLGPFDRPSREQTNAAQRILDELGIGALASRGCMRISGGERQLMLLGRALIQNAHTLIMDEPTASLDYGNSFRVMQRIEALSAGGYSVIFSTHEPNQAFRYATKVLALKDGRVLAFGLPGQVLTPELLPVLKEAGVVDSGGKGLVTILRGFKMVIDGEDVDEYVLAPQMQDTAGITGGEEGADLEALDDIEFGYCTEFFIIHLDESFSEADLDKLREKLMKIGDSVVVAHDSDFIKIHVHSNCPGKILQLALRLGEIDRIKIENMREQNRELLANMKKNEKENALVAVSISDGIDEVYKAIGVNNLISGGQTMNPSIDSITKAIRRANARNVFVLPNNSNIIMAAQQAAAISDRNVIVIPSKTMMQGLSAALAYSDDVDVETNTERMTAAIKQVLSGSVTYAVRDTQFNGEKISQGDIIGLLDNVITKVGTSVDSVAVELLCSMIENKGDDCMATIFYGEGADEDSAQAVADAVNEKYPDAEITVQYGGQPLYYYYFSVE